MQTAFETCAVRARIRHCEAGLKSAFGESRQFLESILQESKEMLKEIDRREAQLRSSPLGRPDKVVS